MAVDNKKVETVITLGLDSIADELTAQCSLEEIVKFIDLLDSKLMDIEFVVQVRAWTDKIILEENLLGEN